MKLAIISQQQLFKKLENELKKELFHVNAAVQENVLSGIGCI